MMHGGPSSIDTFDPKPRLERDNGKPIPFKRGLTFGETSVGGLMKPLWPFKQYGQSGLPVSDLFPHVGSCADDLCVIRSMVGDGVDHGAAMLQLHTGVFQFKRPSMGSWTLYGLGTENQDLPGFITIKPVGNGGQNKWSSSFLPGEYQGTPIGSGNMKVEEIEKEPMPYLVSRGLVSESQRYELDMLQKMNRRNAELNDHDPDLEARINESGASLPKGTVTVAANPMAARLAEGRKYWAFQPTQNPTPPKVKNEKWVKSPVDRFILAKLEEKSIPLPAPRS